jgi:transcriptional regulator with XRE-family HTH domain
MIVYDAPMQQHLESPDHLRNVRVRALLSQRALAQRANVAPSTIALLEAGRSSPTPLLETIRRLSDALGVRPTDIIEFARALATYTAAPDR